MECGKFGLTQFLKVFVLVVFDIFTSVFYFSVLGVVAFLNLFSCRRRITRINSVSVWSGIGLLVFFEFALGLLVYFLTRESVLFKLTRSI